MSSFKNLPAAANDSAIGQLEADPLFSQVEKLLLCLSPIVAPIIGWFTAWVGTHFPGVTVSKSKATDLFIAGVALVVVLVVKYVHSKDKRLGVSSGLAAAGNFVQGEVAKLPDGLVYEDELKKLLENHRQDIELQLEAYEREIEGKLPPNVAQSLSNLLQNVNLGDLLSGKVDPAKLVEHAQPTDAGARVEVGSAREAGLASGAAVGGAAGQTAP